MIDRWRKLDKRIPGILLIALLVGIPLLYGMRHVYYMTTMGKAGTGLLVGYGVVALLVFACVIGIYVLIFYKRIKFETMFLLVIIPFVFGYMAFFVPGRAPDEHSHYLCAYRISNYILFQWDQADEYGLIMRSCDNEFYDEYMNSGPLVRGDYKSLVEETEFFTSNTQKVVRNIPYGSNAPLGHIACAIGMALGRLLHLGAVPVVYMGRIFNAIQYIIMIYIAMKRAPVMRRALLVVSMLPMTLNLVSSLSYDVICIGVTAMFAAEIVRMYDSESVSLRQIVYCVILAMVLAPSKVIYTPIVFLILIIPKNKIKCRYPFIAKFCVIIGAMVSLLLMQLPNMTRELSTDNGTNYIAWAENEGYTIAYMLENPISVIGIYIRTIRTLSTYYCRTMLGSMLGWIQLAIPKYVYWSFGLMVLISSLRTNEEKLETSVVGRLWTFAVALGSAFMGMTVMLLCWTPVSSDIIQGVQGRYFLPLLFLTPIIFGGKMIKIKYNTERQLAMVSVALNVAALAGAWYAFTA